MKRLKASTIAQYNTHQLTSHMDRLLDKFEVAPYRIVFGYGEISEYNHDDNSYHFAFSTQDRRCIIDAIEKLYTKLKM